MPLRDTGDIVKAVGFVTIYGAYLEDRIAELIDDCADRIDLRNNIQKLSASDQAKHLLKGLNNAYDHASDFSVKEEERRETNDVLSAVEGHLKDRHVVVHSTLNAQNGSNIIIRKNRRLGTEEEVSSADVFNLANDLYELQSRIDGLKFSLARLIRALSQ